MGEGGEFFLPGIDHITWNIGCDCPAIKQMDVVGVVDWRRHD